jgi:DNA-binding winged helix-turn-helix (wHTH) protein/tetratricopeptide (TPR) repeat protein/TolB-like protein
MEGTARRTKALRFGPFEADPFAETLHRNGRSVRLQDQPLKLLFLLLDHAGQIVTRDEMRAHLWPIDSFGDFDNGLNVAVRKLRAALGDDSDRPRYIETVPRKGYRFIAEIEVAADPVSTDRSGTLQPSEPLSLSPVPAFPIQSSEPSPRSRTAAKRFAVVASLALLSVLGGLAFVARRHFVARDSPVVAPGTARRSIAVLAFRNSSGHPEDTWLSTALSEMFSTELAAGDHLRLVSEEDIVNSRLAAPSIEVDSVSVATAKQLHKTLKTDLIVSGAYATVASPNDRQVRLDVRLQDAATGEILSEVSGDASEQTLFHVVGQVGERLREKLGVSLISAEENAQVIASMPASREAGEFYSKGLLKLRAYDSLAARDLLRQAIAVEPAFPLSHAALSDAWANLGYDQRAIEEARRAYDLSSSLLPTGRLRVQARYWESTADWDKAAEAYGTLRSSFPDDPEYIVLFARALTRAGKANKAIQVLGNVENGSDPELQLAVADAASALGDMERSAAAAQAAAASARERGQLLLLAKALRANGMALESLARYDQAIAAIEEARTIYERAGDRFGVASTLEVQGNILSDQGDLAGALGKYQQELSIVRDVGNKRGEASALNNMALVLSMQGDPAHSRIMWEQAEAAFRELGDKRNVAIVLVNIGSALQDQGELAAARRNYEQALALVRETRDNSGVALAMKSLATTLDAEGNFALAEQTLRQASAIDVANGHSISGESLVDLGDILRHRGDLAAAATAYRDALTASQANGEKSYSAYAKFGLGQLALLATDYGEARRNYDEALRLRKELGEAFTTAETEAAIAELVLEQGHAAEAEAALRSVQEVFAKADRRDDSALAQALLVRSLLLQGKTSEAARTVDSIGAPVRIQSLGPRLSAMITQGRVQLALAQPSAARKTFQLAIDQAQRAGYREYFLDARLALLQSEPASERQKSELQALCRLAGQSGFKLIEAKCQRGN